MKNFSNQVKSAQDWYEKSYSDKGGDAQRRYPNEEMLRFFARNFFGVPAELKKELRVLEVGCGSCANLWVIAKEGFDTYGLDLSSNAIELGEATLNAWGVRADLRIGSMTELPYPSDFFDVILDVFSSYCLTEVDFSRFIVEVKRTSRSGAKFFSYFPSKLSDAFLNHSPAQLIDSSTLNGIHRADSPFSCNHYPFRFMHPEEYKKALEENGLKVDYLETVTRSYRSMNELFQHIVVEATKR